MVITHAIKDVLNHYVPNVEKVSIATIRIKNGAAVLSNITGARANSSRGGKLSFGDVDILVTNPQYDLNSGIEPWDHFLNYLFPTEAMVHSDFDRVWNSGLSEKINNGQEITKEEIDQLKRIASCGTQYLSAAERYGIIKAVLLFNDREYYEDLVLDIMATVDTKAKAKDLYERINNDAAFQELLIDNIDDITTYLFFDDKNENNLSRFTKEYFKLFKQVYSNQELTALYNSERFPERNKFFFYGFDHGCDYDLSGERDGDRVTIEEQPKKYDWGKFTIHFLDKGDPVRSTFGVGEILGIAIADKNVSLFGERDQVVMMPALAYYLLIKAANQEELETVINGLLAIIGVVTPFDEFYFLSQALKLSHKGFRAAHMATIKGLSRIEKIKVSLKTRGATKLKSDAKGKIDDYVTFVEEAADAGGSLLTKLDNPLLSALKGKVNQLDDVLKPQFLDDFADASDDVLKKLQDENLFDVWKNDIRSNNITELTEYLSKGNLRNDYITAVESISDRVTELRNLRKTDLEIAQEVFELRRQTAINFKNATPDDMLPWIFEFNDIRYTQKGLGDKWGLTWDGVVSKATKNGVTDYNRIIQGASTPLGDKQALGKALFDVVGDKTLPTLEKYRMTDLIP